MLRMLRKIAGPVHRTKRAALALALLRDIVAKCLGARRVADEMLLTKIRV